jgi:uncharacterized protein (TIGR01777 family)
VQLGLPSNTHHDGAKEQRAVRILLTGGTGFIGKAVTSAFRTRGDAVVVVTRDAASGGGGEETVGWGAVENEVGRSDAIVHLAGEPVADARWTPARLERIRSSRVDTTLRLARAIASAARKPRVFVSASAVGLYGMRRDSVLCDEQTAASSDVLGRICVAWEAAAEPASVAGVRVVHPRFGVVLGKGGALAKMAPPYRWFAGGPLGDGTQWVSWIHVKDVARAILFLVDREALTGAVNVVGPTPVTMNDLAHALGRVLRRPSVFRVPATALRLALGDGLAEVLLTGQRVSARRLEEAGFTFEFPALEPALADVL